MRSPSKAFWRNKRVLLTGHTGFKGAWLALWLRELGAEVSGLALPSTTTPSLFELLGGSELIEQHYEVDIRDSLAVRRAVAQVQPQIVLHLAAQALVRASYRTPLETLATNVMGTAHVLDALRGQSEVRAVVAVTTDKVYLNHEQPKSYREDDALGGYDLYSASKAACDIVVGSYRQSFLADRGVALASARAGNVIGGGDWAEDRLLPDAVRAWGGGVTLDIRRPDAVRPWQHVLEPLAGYLILAEQLWEKPKLAAAYNFGPPTTDAATVREVITLARQTYGQGETTFATEVNGPHEASLLQLDITKARTVLDFAPRWNLQQSVCRTMNWYRTLAQGSSAMDLCCADILAYEACK
nr:CDP-glucose 4,6-dehydratase [uncultured Rhodoferax sp.]